MSSLPLKGRNVIQPPSSTILRHSNGGKYISRRKDYSPLAWNTYFQNMYNVNDGEDGSKLPALVQCRCIAVDLRGHGDTTTPDDLNLSTDRMTRDIQNVVEALYGDDPPPIVLIGHSMGGAVAVHVADRGMLPSLVGLCVIDVVEGTALEAMNSMQAFLRGRPKEFSSMDQAIQWCVRSGQIHNLDSARVSVAGQLRRVESAESPGINSEPRSAHSHVLVDDTIQEDDEDSMSDVNSMSKGGAFTGVTSADDVREMEHSQNQLSHYTWRIDLSRTEQFWSGWFQGLSKTFLSCEVPKMLLLAGVDRLDKDLTIGQMQGKFQMHVLPRCGHVVHEDAPDKVVDVLAAFLMRHKIAEATTAVK